MKKVREQILANIHNIFSKEQFVAAIRRIEEQDRRVNEFNDALDKMCDGHPVFDFENGYLKTAVDALSVMFEQEPGAVDNDIEYYLWENHDKNSDTYYSEFAGYRVCVNTPEMLYEHLVAQMLDKRHGCDYFEVEFYEHFGTPASEEKTVKCEKFSTVQF